MPIIRRIFKKRGVVSVPPDATVEQAARQMTLEKVGSVLVMEKGTPVGIFTERDLLNRVVAKGSDARTTPIREVMSKRLVTIDIDASTEECYNRMQETKCRRVPISEDGKIVGMITMRDILERVMETLQDENRHLQDYIRS
ncbi:MAG: CBS domain-containing protein [Deltaproteobacteria bacterium]|nr:CBS domain-containing protein [Deltaproteobacteria bacterium]